MNECLQLNHEAAELGISSEVNENLFTQGNVAASQIDHAIFEIEC